MNAMSWILVVLALMLGMVAGAGLLWLLLRTSLQRARETADTATHQLGVAGAELAAARAQVGELRTRVDGEVLRGGEDQAVLRALAPVAEKLQQVQTQVALLERDRVEQFGQLSQQLASAAEQDAALLRTTASLSSALRNSSMRGAWGEVQLRRVVEAAGMLPHVDFDEQVVTADRLRPDMVVNLPGGKSIVIDAKVPLDAYLRAQDLSPAAGPESAARHAELLASHAKALRAHVDALGSKKYWESVGGSPELVICFLPAESFLAEALAADATLLDHAFSKNVALASPATLLAMLKGLAFAWRQELLTDNARALFEQSRELYERLGTMGGHVGRLGSSLRSSVEKYNSFVGALETRVLPAARRIRDLDPGIGAGIDPAAKLHEVATLDANPRVLGAAELLDDTSIPLHGTA